MSWFRRLSRDRFSRYESDFHGPEHFDESHAANRERALGGDGSSSGAPAAAKRGAQSGGSRPQTSYGEQQSGPARKDAQYSSSNEMLRRPPAGRAAGAPDAQKPYRLSNGSGVAAGATAPHPDQALDPSSPTNPSAANAFTNAPDPLTRAFNEALAPYHDRLAGLQAELAASRAQIQALEADRAALHAWIDRRGLRPDLPPSLAAALPDSTSAVAAGALATQLDRKTTMLNFGLHQLADALPEGVLPTYTVASTLLSVTRQIRYLSGLPGGSAFAFEALVKLAGNFNSHTAGGSAGDGRSDDDEADGGGPTPGDALAPGRRRGESQSGVDGFYENLDFAMGDVVRKRLAAVREGAEFWDVAKDVRRLDKTAAFLRKELGIQRYFARSLETMRREGAAPAGNGTGGAAVAGAAPPPPLGEEGFTRYSEESR